MAKPDPQSLSSWLITLDTCDSTNTWALAHAEALAHGAVVWTEAQTAGRGRQGRSWLAPAGVLTASFVCAIADHSQSGPLSLAAGLAVIHACEDLCPGLSLGLKWPNDVLLDGKKLAGILSERTSGSPAAMIIGVGLNRAPVWPTREPPVPCASLAAYSDLDALELLTLIRKYLLEAAGLVQLHGLAPLLTQLQQRDTLRGRHITLDDGGRIHHGEAAGIDGEGRLILMTAMGPQHLRSGHIISTG